MDFLYLVWSNVKKIVEIDDIALPLGALSEYYSNILLLMGFFAASCHVARLESYAGKRNAVSVPKNGTNAAKTSIQIFGCCK